MLAAESATLICLWNKTGYERTMTQCHHLHIPFGNQEELTTDARFEHPCSQFFHWVHFVVRIGHVSVLLLHTVEQFLHTPLFSAWHTVCQSWESTKSVRRRGTKKGFVSKRGKCIFCLMLLLFDTFSHGRFAANPKVLDFSHFCGTHAGFQTDTSAQGKHGFFSSRFFAGKVPDVWHKRGQQRKFN